MRTAFRAALVFGQPWRAPGAWWADQNDHGARPSFVAATVAVRRLPQAKLELIQGAGHLPQVECPDAVIAAVLPLLAAPGGPVSPAR